MSYSPNPEKGYLAFSLIAIFFVCLVASCTPAVASDVEDVFKTETVRIPHTQQVCEDVYHGGDKSGDMLRGAIIGGILGNQNSTASGNICRTETRYTEQSKTVYSHSTITFVYEGKQYSVNFKK